MELRIVGENWLNIMEQLCSISEQVSESIVEFSETAKEIPAVTKGEESEEEFSFYEDNLKTAEKQSSPQVELDSAGNPWDLTLYTAGTPVTYFV